MSFTLSRRSLLAAGAAALAVPGLVRPGGVRAGAGAYALPPLSYRRTFGESEIVALSDGYFLLDNAFLNIASESVTTAIAASYLEPALPQVIGVTAHLVFVGGRTVLIDTGCGNTSGRLLGYAGNALAAVNIAPKDVDAVLLTHMHPDHMGGLLADGRAAFPTATVHVSAADLAYWTDEPQTSANWNPSFALAREIAAAYHNRIVPFSGDAEVVPGITALALPGHTVGHTGFLVSSGNTQILVFGDTAHSAAVQFSHPEAGLAFDTDPVQAAATRSNLFSRLATDRTLVAGTHMPFPSLGHVARLGAAYAWVPEEWRYE